MTGGIDRELLAERAASVIRHLDRVVAHLLVRGLVDAAA